MSQSYQLLFEVISNHNYYEDGIAPDMAFKATAQTAQILKDYKLKANYRPGRFAIYFQSRDGSTPIIDPSDVSLTFLIEVKNAIEFLNFTNLNTIQDYTGKKKVLFQNNPSETATINHSLIDLLRGNLFTYQSPLSTTNPSVETIDLVIRHLITNETVTVTNIPADENGNYNTSVDLTQAKSGLYTFESTNTTSLESASEQVYVDEAISKQLFFGIVEINFQPNAPAIYELAFQRRTTLWNYILVNKTSRTDFDDLEVKDNSTTNENPYQTYQFERLAETTQVGQSEAVVFQSEEEIPFFQNPKLEIELVKEMNGSDMILLKNLSNPSLDQISSDPNESDIYVFV